MAKFCTKCGEKLEEGVKHVCDNSVKETEKEEKKVKESTTSSIDFGEYANKYIEMVKGIFTKPIETIKKYSTVDNFALTIVALVVNCIVTGFMFYFFVKEALGILAAFLGFGSLNLLSTGNIEVPFLKVFIQGVIYMASWFATAGIAIYLIANMIMKDKIDIKKAYALVGTCSAFTTVTMLLTILCIFINTTLAIVVLLVAATFYLTYLYQGLSDLTEIDKNKLAYVFVPSVAAAMFVMVYILPKIFS